MEISTCVKYVGVNDHQVDLFEGQYKVPNGMSYNSYVILDEKIAVMDTVDGFFTEEWLNNVEQVLSGKTPDYLVIQHMEPDHSASIPAFLKKYPNATVVSTAKGFQFMEQFFPEFFAGQGLPAEQRIVAANDGVLELGQHSLHFVYAPMVHWPEVMMTYEATEKILFAADGFGKFGALDAAEESGVVIAYASVYGNTRNAAEYLADVLQEKGQKTVLYDLARCDKAKAVADAFRYDRLVLAGITYNGDLFPCMRSFIEGLTERNYQNRKVAIIENGTWAPMAGKLILGMFEKSKNLTFTETTVSIKSAMNEQNKGEIGKLAEELS